MLNFFSAVMNEPFHQYQSLARSHRRYRPVSLQVAEEQCFRANSQMQACFILPEKALL